MKPKARRNKGQKIETGMIGYTPDTPQRTQDYRQNDRQPPQEEAQQQDRQGYQDRPRQQPYQKRTNHSDHREKFAKFDQKERPGDRQDKKYPNRYGITQEKREEIKKVNEELRKKHPTLLPTGLAHEFFIDSPQCNPPHPKYMTDQEVKNTIYSAFENIRSFFAYKEQYYEISYKMSHGAEQEGSIVSFFSHLHKSLDDCVNRYYPHSHRYPIELVSVSTSKTTSMSQLQLSNGSESDFMFKGALPQFDSAFRLEEMLLNAVLFNDIRQLEMVNKDNAQYMSPEVSQVLTTKKTKLSKAVAEMMINNMVEVFRREKGLRFVKRIFSLLPDDLKAQVAGTVVGQLAVLFQMDNTYPKERLDVFTEIGTYISEVNDVIQVSEYIGNLLEMFGECGKQLLGEDYFEIIKGILQNQTLKNEEPDLYQEFLEGCCGVLEEHTGELSKAVVDFIEKMKV
ncbi:hypothetical protein EIN_096390 [Entamoeba invadens IP1]|uniref:Uncharacterized protein n=1 Tax=Entamoeba invadens IP1 TaxID=370355 RepID=A0A0A1U0J3_ENTIV|nr:hypothetical protein EIN_096390 [Entamoeba invadens IP1]ELP87382.1 hypothetical protein EIN_096390 [Entamoeba invadens IP1]|eukprot:XP_004254153.1 hypothetical protein EIN_096390 [Entamoeba invadens IP1]